MYACIYMYMYVCISCICVMYECIYVCMCMCMCMCIYIYMYMYVYIYIYIYIYIACMCSLFHSSLGPGNEDEGFQLVYESACCLAWGVIFDRRKDRGVVCVFSIFGRGWECMWRCLCVYTHTHTHTAQMGYLDVTPGVGMRHLEGPKNPDGLNLGICIFVYVYTVNVCIYMLRGGMRSWTDRFFLLTCLFF